MSGSAARTPVEARPVDATQTLLLRAALLDGAASLAAWEQWKTSLDGGPLPPGSHRLLPLLYRNLERLRVADPRLARLRGVYRKSWYRNQTLLDQAAPVLRALGAANIDTLLLSATALTVGHYRDDGVRPLSALELCVPAEQRSQALQALTRLGWRPAAAGARAAELLAVAPRYLSLHHVLELTRRGHRLHLSWHVCPMRRHRSADRTFWEAARRVALRGVATRIPDAADLLVLTCVAGMRADAAPWAPWAADAAAVVRDRGAELDWQRVVALARGLELAVSVRQALAFLAAAVDAPIPPDVQAALAALPASSRERRERRAASSPGLRAALAGRLRQRLLHFQQSAEAPRPRSLARYLSEVWQFERPWRLPLVLAGRSLRRWRARVEP